MLILGSVSAGQETRENSESGPTLKTSLCKARRQKLLLVSMPPFREQKLAASLFHVKEKDFWGQAGGELNTKTVLNLVGYLEPNRKQMKTDG